MAKQPSVDRRNFLKTAAVTGAAALTAGSGSAVAQQPAPRRPRTAPTPPRETDPALDVEVLTTERPGGDFMVDVLKTLDFEYVASNPGSSFRGIHESPHQLRRQSRSEFITCCHEESSVAMAHGYFKAEGKPMAVMVHGTVGLQHAAMAIYNAYCDRVPVYILAGNTLDATHAASGRRVGAQRAGRGGDGPRLHQVGRSPVSLPHFAESAVRAYKIAMTPPMMPVAAGHRRRTSGGSDFAGGAGTPAHSEAHIDVAASG